MAIRIRDTLGLVKNAALGFWKDECPRMAAALSYYTVFSLPPFLILLVTIAGLVLDPKDIQGAIYYQMQGLLGEQGALQVKAMMENANRPGSGSEVAAIFSVAALLFGATGVFLNLQTALNDAWQVEPDPKKGGIKNFLLKRVFSFGLILAIVFVMLVSLALTALLTALGKYIGGGLPESVLLVLNSIFSFAIVTLLFAAMYKYLPDASIAWRDVSVGAIVTAILFDAGKFLLGFYLGKNDPGSVFGAAGSLALVLIWIYYASMIVLFGAEFTEAWAEERGGGIKPKAGATRVVEQKVRIRPGQKSEVEKKQP
jgi:membrane protein